VVPKNTISVGEFMKVKLRVIEGAKMGDIELELPVTIGRGREAQMTLALPLVSRLHCEIYSEADQAFVRDLKSTNGTSVAGCVIDAPTLLAHGELLTIGSATFQIVSDDSPLPEPVISSASPEPTVPEPIETDSGAPATSFPEPVVFNTDTEAAPPAPVQPVLPESAAPTTPAPSSPAPMVLPMAKPIVPSGGAAQPPTPIDFSQPPSEPPASTTPASSSPAPMALPMAKPIVPSGGAAQPPTPIDFSQPPSEPPVGNSPPNDDKELGNFFKRHKK